ncbi:tRNA-specific adenosine deaminase [Planctomycetales bacterium]|nr:tRNA-specific adenosine deaminase [Planctomycetales bacterium]
MRYNSAMTIDDYEQYIRAALIEAQTAAEEGEVPVGAVIVHTSENGANRLIASAHNQREQLNDPTAHAEIIAITQAAEAIGSWRLENCTLFVTLEPCIMCSGAILQSRIQTVVYGASDGKGGAVNSLFRLLDDSRLNHRCNVISGILAEQCGAVLTAFFQKQRAAGKK